MQYMLYIFSLNCLLVKNFSDSMVTPKNWNNYFRTHTCGGRIMDTSPPHHQRLLQFNLELTDKLLHGKGPLQHVLNIRDLTNKEIFIILDYPWVSNHLSLLKQRTFSRWSQRNVEEIGERRPRRRSERSLKMAYLC